MCWHCQRQPCLHYYCNLCWFCSCWGRFRSLCHLLSHSSPLLHLCFLYRLRLDGLLCRPSVARHLPRYLSKRTLKLVHEIGVIERTQSSSQKQQPCVKKQGKLITQVMSRNDMKTIEVEEVDMFCKVHHSLVSIRLRLTSTCFHLLEERYRGRREAVSRSTSVVILARLLAW